MITIHANQFVISLLATLIVGIMNCYSKVITLDNLICNEGEFAEKYKFKIEIDTDAKDVTTYWYHDESGIPDVLCSYSYYSFNVDKRNERVKNTGIIISFSFEEGQKPKAIESLFVGNSNTKNVTNCAYFVLRPLGAFYIIPIKLNGIWIQLEPNIKNGNNLQLGELLRYVLQLSDSQSTVPAQPTKPSNITPSTSKQKHIDATSLFQYWPSSHHEMTAIQMIKHPFGIRVFNMMYPDFVPFLSKPFFF